MAKRPRISRDYSPVSWLHYFDEALDICPDLMSDSDQSRDIFRVYLKNFRPPLAPNRKLATTISDHVQSETSEDELQRYSEVPTLVTLHGGGYSGLTWAQFAHYINQDCRCRILSLDLRSHGDTKTKDDGKMDIETLVQDVITVIHETHKLCGFIETPKIVLVGHSMGGAIAVKCSSECNNLLPSLAGFVIIDVVEGTAKDALPLMMSVIETRPKQFPSLCAAIEWSIRSGMAKNLDAARVSMPGNLLNIDSGHLGIHDVDPEDADKKELLSTITKHKFHVDLCRLMPSGHAIGPTILPRQMPAPSLSSPRVKTIRSESSRFPRPSLGASIDEIPATMPTASKQDNMDKSHTLDSTFDNDRYKRPLEFKNRGYCWRTDLAKTQPYWSGWFDGLSEQLLNAPVQGKFLLLAGIDRLDKTLTIGQMQGKFMMKVLPKCGHAVHEDVPHQVASVIGQFLVRNKFATTIANMNA